MKTNPSTLLALTVLVGVFAKEAAMAELRVTSNAFQHNQPIPKQYTCEGADVSPPLHWSGAAGNVKSFALIGDDPDAPAGTWVHWVLFNVPPDTTELPENVAKVDALPLPAGARQGMNDFKKVGYGGPCPPRGHGIHHYHFKMYALDTMLNLPPRAAKQQVEMMMRGHILAQGELMGTYQRR